jgi:predicted SAM-dependent methyltransferase
MAAMFRARTKHYRSADLNMKGCDLKLNIEKMGLPDESVGTFVASHILEHVDDRAALAELHRCLRRGGTLIAMIPIVEGWASSYENPALPSGERALHFGQWDHVRVYGRDFRDRVRDAGFHLTEWSASGEECVRHGLRAGEAVFVGTKVSSAI